MNLSLDVLRQANALQALNFPQSENKALRGLIDTVLQELVEMTTFAEQRELSEIERQKIAIHLAEALINLDRLATHTGVDLGLATMHRWNENSSHLNSRLRILDTRWGVEVQELWDSDDDGA